MFSLDKLNLCEHIFQGEWLNHAQRHVQNGIVIAEKAFNEANRKPPWSLLRSNIKEQEGTDKARAALELGSAYQALAEVNAALGKMHEAITSLTRSADISRTGSSSVEDVIMAPAGPKHYQVVE